MGARKARSKRLTIAGFLKRLRRHKSAGWYLAGESIRGRDGYSCPLTYVASPRRFLPATLWRDAAQKLHITEKDAGDIVAAADTENVYGERAKLRAKLLRAVGL